MGDISLRIAGINTPEMDDRCEFATCKVGNGEAARAELVKLLAGRVVVCAGARKVADTDKEESKKARPPVESLGRPVVECRVWLKDSRPIELGPEMVKSGYGRACRKGGSVDDAYWIDIIAAHLTSQDASDGPSRTSLSCPKGEYDADGKKGGPSG
jgi:endonuclease YncB( thermonuclease family)